VAEILKIMKETTYLDNKYAIPARAALQDTFIYINTYIHIYTNKQM